MKFIDFIRKKAVDIEVRKKSEFNYSVEKQKNILMRFPQPIDLIERSYFQYKCQAALNGRVFSFLLNVFSFPLVIIYYFKKYKFNVVESKKYDAVFFADTKPNNIVPSELKEEFGVIVSVNEKKYFFSSEDRKYVFSLWKRYPFSYFFIFKCLLKIQNYSYEINYKKPKAMIVCNEYSFTSSMLTDYCRKRNVLNINIMHGEKLFFIRDAFFQYDRCYVWGEEYIELFKQLRVDPKQFIIAVPKSLCFDNSFYSYNKAFDYKYYLGNERGERLAAIFTTLRALSNEGLRIAVRPHPRYSNIDEIKTMAVDSIVVEDCVSIPIEQSIMETKNVISLYSTVLNQAYHNGVNIVIDDVSDKKTYMQLNQLGYVMMSRDYTKLSECLKNRVR